MYSTLISKKCEVHVIPEVKDYITSIVSKSKLTKSSSLSNSTLIVNKYNDVIPYKFKIVKFMTK